VITMKINWGHGVMLLLIDYVIFLEFKSRPYPSIVPALIREFKRLLLR